MLARGDLVSCDAWCASIVGARCPTSSSSINGNGNGGTAGGARCDKRKCAAHMLARCVFAEKPKVPNARQPYREVDPMIEEMKLAQSCSWESKEVLVGAAIDVARCGTIRGADTRLLLMGGCGGCATEYATGTDNNTGKYVGTGYYLMGLMFENGLGVVRDSTKSVEANKISASLGHSMGQHNLARAMSKCEGGAEQNPVEVVRLLELSAAQGNARGQLNLSIALRQGIGTPVNVERSLQLLRLSANQGYSYAQMNLAIWVKETNPEEAFQLFTSAAVQGCPPAQNHLGIAYCKGLNVHTDRKEGVKWFRLSASQGDIPALRNLAGYYQGVTNRDIKEAFRLYLLAESKGDKKSSQDLFALRESYT